MTLSAGMSQKFSFYKQPDVIAALEHLRLKINLDLPQSESVVSTKDLARFVQKLQTFQKDALGFSAVAAELDSPLVRIPAKLFKDLSPNGSLYTILRAAYVWRVENGVRRWDLDNKSKRALFVDMVRQITAALKKAGLLKYPCIALSESLSSKIRKELTEIAGKLQMSIRAPGSPEVTHLLQECPEHDDNNTSTGEEWYRSLEKRPGFVLLHYWYQPDSNDRWVPESSGDYLDPEPAPQHKGPWCLAIRWLRDSYQNNEWMNEEDYEADSSQSAADDEDGLNGEQDEAEAEVDGDSDGNASGVEEDELSDLSLEANEEDEEEDEDEEDEDEDGMKSVSRRGSIGRTRVRGATLEIEDDEDGLSITGRSLQDGPIARPHVRPVDLNKKGIRSRKYEYEPVPEAVIRNISHTEGLQVPPGTAYIHTKPKSQKYRWAFLKQVVPVKTREIGADRPVETSSDTAALKVDPDSTDADKSQVTLDTAADKAVKVSDVGTEKVEIDQQLELANLAIFQSINIPNTPWFDFSSVHKIERETVLGNLGEHVDANQERKYLRMRNGMIQAYIRDVSSSLTIEECCKFLDERLEDVAPVHRFLEYWGLINFPTTKTEPTDIRSMFQGLCRQRLDPTIDATISAVPPVYTPPETSQHPTSDMDVDPKGDSSKSFSSPMELTCETCKASCDQLAYQQIKKPHIVLCPDCYLNGNFPSDTPSSDFMCLQGISREQGPSYEPWTESEILRLLEAVEMFGTNWEKIAHHVGPVRGPHECLVQFLRSDLAEPISNPTISEEKNADAPTTITALNYTPNPIMALLKLLTSVVHPGIAAEAAKEALAAGAELLSNQDWSTEISAKKGEIVARMLRVARSTARELSEHESNEIKTLIVALTDYQVRKLTLKIQSLRDVDALFKPVALPTS
ncbi:hypothetical protein DFS34DRAFT_632287 [Phlyctochytrium arcticum]|nr:hypothetical protein DFS34DRAFT_632287 [Phlyctochytrium arcticum]